MSGNINFKCHVCGGDAAREECISEVFTFGERRVLVEAIPAQLCARCGEPTISCETTERIRGLVHGEGKPVRSESLEVFALS